MKYQTKPGHVEAFVITGVADKLNEDGTLSLALDNGENVEASVAMMARMTPVQGDYWVVQPDGYVYLNPKEVFERKYEPLSYKPS